MPRGVSRYDEARVQRRLWTPDAWRGDMSCWFDMSDPQLLTLATGISQAKSRHNTGVMIEQGTGANQPTVNMTGINGRRCVSFGASNQVLLQFTTANATMSNAFLFGIVASATSASGANTRILTWAPSGNDYDNASSVALLYRVSANNWETYQNGAIRATTGSCTDGTPHVFVVESDGTTCRHYRNGTAGGSGNWGTISLGSSGRWLIGGYSSGGSSTDYRGLWGEGVVVRNYQGPRGRQLLEGYLAHRWGLSESLAGTHPYRNAPPLI